MGTPEIASGVLETVLSMRADHPEIELVGVFTQPDKPVGRKQIMTPPPVKVTAEKAGIPVFQPKRIKRPSQVEILRELGPDLILVTAYGQILSQEILDIPALGCINMHASLLPKYRGAAPINWVIVNGETVTGVTAMRMDAGMDTGDMLMSREVQIAADETADTLYQKLTEEGSALIRDVMEKLLAGEELVRVPQHHEEATYAPIISKEDGLIDWTVSAHAVDCRVRGFLGWPGAYSFLDDKKCTIMKSKVVAETCGEAWIPEALSLRSGEAVPVLLTGKRPRLVIRCGKDFLEILELQLQGKKAMDAGAFLRGYQAHHLYLDSSV